MNKTIKEMTKEEKIQYLKSFEEEVISLYLNKKILSPVHLNGGDETENISIFEKIKEEDWVVTNYRSHYQALLKGMPKEELLEWILDNKSIHLMSSKYKIVSSAIVGGSLPIAVGIAKAIKMNNENEHVWYFTGDMTASLGVFHDCWQYSVFNDLPITFIVADNTFSTDTPSKIAWGMDENQEYWWEKKLPKIIYYKYTRIYQHYGVSKQGEDRIIVNFDDGKKGLQT